MAAGAAMRVADVDAGVRAAVDDVHHRVPAPRIEARRVVEPHLDALAELHQMRRGVESRPPTRRMQNRIEHRGDRTLPVRAGDVHAGHRLFRMADFRRQQDHPVDAEARAAGLDAMTLKRARHVVTENQRTLDAYRPLFTELAVSLGTRGPADPDEGSDPMMAMMADVLASRALDDQPIFDPAKARQAFVVVVGP